MSNILTYKSIAFFTISLLFTLSDIFFGDTGTEGQVSILSANILFLKHLKLYSCLFLSAVAIV